MTYLQPALWIGGTRVVGAGETLAVTNPATGKVVASFRGAASCDVSSAVAAAETAFEVWRQTSCIERERVMRRAADEVRAAGEVIAAALVVENGKPLAEACAEVQATAEVLDFYAGEARRSYGRTIPARTQFGRIATVREPVGVVAAFVPWNFPAVNLVRKLAPALAAGCTVVAKPAEETPATGLAIAECLHRAGLTSGAVNLVYGNPGEISSALIEALPIVKISFTGSTVVGRQLAGQAGVALKRMTMELGGHAPVIVCGDVDVDRAADMAAAAKFRNAGQTCNSASRFYVHRSIYERFIERFAANASAVRVGAGMSPETTMGPLSNERRVLAVQALVDDAIARGARLVAGGRRMSVPGFFFEPTVLADVPAVAEVLKKEPFGPVAPIVPFDEIAEAVSYANSTRFGLAGYVLTEHGPTARRLAAEIRSGVVAVNSFVAAYPETPFGGLGESGWGHEGGPEGIEAYLQTRLISEA
ncbi:NAD-dependent succinate-semialdehyde dehydrogenase [Ensifer sp. ENS04]|uniref:NAD-dependent succinate-semialdehyde dehydrogenase n=1 Tax=Ensifer sp. ENS04 TaxID=2769281 RepID=UPI00177D285B|nr:NAD-dependent succinate-semialdehyde dehydrogenase [Ensifer sp. ENS04]MBD9541450.1 NAD-dependent succinate-semialdehyde dehydrogenase [Ensifer sp. ENS04]